MNKRLGLLLVIAAVSLPIVIAVSILVFGTTWFPAGDMAQAELHMRGFFAKPPLVGAAGRIVGDTGIQGSHPGPSLWFAMLPVYLLGGRSSDALMAAAASVHLVSIAAILFLARRRGGIWLVSAMGLSLLAVLRSSGADFMIEPWNPWLGLLPFGLFVLLSMEVLAPVRIVDIEPTSPRKEAHLQLAAAVVVGSHCVQSHAGYALLVVPPIVVCLVTVIARRLRVRRDSGLPLLSAPMKPLAFAVLPAVAVWLGPLLDQMRRDPGNITILLQHFGTPEEPTLGLTRSLEVVMGQMNLLGPWLWGPNAATSNPSRTVGFLGFVALFLWAVHRSREHGTAEERTLLKVLGMFLLLGVLSITRIFGPFFEYTIRWFWVLVSFTVALCVWITVRHWRRPATLFGTTVGANKIRLRLSSVLFWVLLAVMSGLTSWQTADRVKLPGATDSRIIAGLVDDVSKDLDPDKTYQVRFYDPYTLNATGFGMTLELERRGFSVKVDPQFAAAALPHRTAPMELTDEVLWVVVGPAIEAAREDAALSEVASYNPRSPEQQIRADALLNELRKGLVSAGRDELVSSLVSPGASILFADPPLPEETAELVRELIQMGQPTSIFRMSVGDVARSLG